MTGSNASGYTLTSVGIPLPTEVSITGYTVSIWTSTAGSPGTLVGTLTNPAVDTSTPYVFTTTGTALDASTPYFVVLDSITVASSGTWTNTTTDDEDTGGLSDWSIENSSLYRSRDTTGGWTTWQDPKRLRINGTAKTVNTAPTVVSVAVTSTPAVGDTYGLGETIEFTATFSEAVTVTGDPQFEFSLTDTDTPAAYNAAASTATTVVFHYTVQAGDEDTNGIWIGSEARTFKLDSDDSIKSTANNIDAVLTHSSLNQQSGHKVAGTPANTPPTSANNTVTTEEDTVYTFSLADFPFMDDDVGDALEFVQILTIPADGTLSQSGLTFTDGTNNLSDADVPYGFGISFFDGTTGRFTYTPPADANGDGYTSLMFRVGDGTDFSDQTYTLTITVTPVNDDPTGAPAISGTATVGETLTADPSPIMDADGLASPTFTYQWMRVDSDGSSNPTNVGSNSATYTLVAADVGKKFKVQVSFTDDMGSDESVTSEAYPLTGTVMAANDPPTVVSVAVTSTPAVGDTYGLGETIEFTATFSEAVTVTGDPQFEFSLTDTNTPAAYNAAASTATTVVFHYTVQAGDEDTNGIWIGNEARTFKLDSDDSIKSTANNIDAILTHTSLNQQSGHKVAGTPVNTPPTSMNNTVTTEEDTVYTFKLTDFPFMDDDAGDALEFVWFITIPTDGTLSSSGITLTDGTNNLTDADLPIGFTTDFFDGTFGRVTYTPPADAHGTGYASFMFQVNDGIEDNDSPTYTMTIDVTPINDDPVVATEIPDQAAAVGTAFSYQFPATAFNDVDGDALTYTATKSDDTTLPTWLTFSGNTRTFSGTPTDAGTVSVKVTATDPSGESVSDTFDIVVAAAVDMTCAAPNFGDRRNIRTGTVTVGTLTVEGTTSAHGFFVADSISDLDNTGFSIGTNAYTIDEVSVSVFGPNDGDLIFSLTNMDLTAPEVAALKLHVCNTPYDFSVATPVTGHSYTWDLDLDWSGFTTRTVYLSVPANVTAPTNEDSAYTFTVADFNFADTDAIDALRSVKITTLPGTGKGTLSVNGTAIAAGELPKAVTRAELAANGLTYTPPQDANGDAYTTFGFKVNDGAADSADYSMTIDVTAENDDPVLANMIPNQSAVVGTAFSHQFLPDTFTDVDGDTLTYTAVKSDSNPLPSWLTFTAATRTFTGTPLAADVDTVSVTVTATDPGGLTAEDTFDIRVRAVLNTAPTAANGAVTLFEDSVYTFTAADFNFADTDPGAMLDQIIIDTLPASGILSWNNANLGELPFWANRMGLDAGVLKYTPPANAYGAGYASFMFRVNDGEDSSDTAYSMTIDVTGVDDDPVLTNMIPNQSAVVGDRVQPPVSA